jgi:predicted RNA-binding protein with PUA-like domain
MACLLLKSEPDSFSIDDLRRKKVELWDGVRNYQARNYMLASKVGDLAFFYHSNAKPPGIAGLCRVVEVGVVDPTQFNKESRYYDPRSKKDDPLWRTIKVEFAEKFPNFLSLDQLREKFSPEDLIILRRGSRLSVTPVDDTVADRLLALAHEPR